MDDLIQMERAVLGTLLESPDQIKTVLDRVPPEQWSGPHHLITEALQAMVDVGEPVSPVTLMAKMRKLGTLNRVGGAGTLATLVESRANGGTSEALFVVDGLESAHLRRQARQVAMRAIQRLDNLSVEPEEAVLATQDEFASLSYTAAGVETEDWPDYDTDPPEQWIIPGLLAVDERMMLTGGEGSGKTMLIRQLIASVTVGRHPWTFAEFAPAPALHLDLENPQANSDSAYRRIRNGLRLAGVDPARGLLHRITPRQFDVCSSGDVAHLMRVVRAVRPKLIAIGPLKNMSSENLNDEDAAVKVTNTLNRVRAESGAALIVEAHAGHGSRGEGGDWRPRGSSSFMAWPEFGLGLRPISKPPAHRSAQLVPWRGARVMGRQWPEHIVESTVYAWCEDPRIENP